MAGVDYSKMSLEELKALQAERVAQKQASTVKPVGQAPMPPASFNPTESTGAPQSAGLNFSFSPTDSLVPTEAPQTVHEPSLPAQERHQRAIARLPWYEQLALGLGSAPAAAWQGVKQAVGGDVSDDEIARVRAAQGTGAGMTGAIGGNLAMLGLPMTKAAQSIEKLSKFVGPLSKSPNFTRALTALGLSGAEGAALTPTMEDETRLGNAAKSAGATAVLGTAGKVLTQAIKPSKSAELLMEKGVQPTISQGAGGAGGKTLGYLEDLTEALPLLNTMVKGSRERAEEELVKIAARRASPYGAAPESMSDITRGTWFKKQDEAFDKGYKEVLSGQTINLGGSFKVPVGAQVQAALDGASDSAKADIAKVLNTNLKPLGMVTSGEQWHEAFKEIRKAKRAEQASVAKTGDRDAKRLVEAYKTVEQSMLDARNTALKATGDEDKIAKLTNLDEAYAHHQIFRTAAENAKAGGEGGVKLEHLIKAVEDTTPPKLLVRGEGRLQDLTEPSKTVFEKSLASGKDALQRRISNATAGAVITGGGGAAMGPAGLAIIPAIAAGSSVAASRPVSKLLFGNTMAQKFLANQMRNKTAAMGASYPIGTKDTEE